MNAKDWFAVGVRIIGLLSFGRGFLDLFSVVMTLNLSTISVVSDSYYNTLRLGLIYFFVGLYLLRGAPLLINYAFPNKQNEIENKDTKETVELQN